MGRATRELRAAALDVGAIPTLAFTNPNTSTSGRNVLVSLYSMYADKTRRSELDAGGRRRTQTC